MHRFRPQDDIAAFIRSRHHSHAGVGFVKARTGDNRPVLLLCIDQIGEVEILAALQQGSVLNDNIAGPQHDAAASVDLAGNINAGVIVIVNRPPVRHLYKIALFVPLAELGEVAEIIRSKIRIPVP